MKKIFTLFFSLMVFAGVKAQTVPQVKKETVNPTNSTPVVNESIQMDTKVMTKNAGTAVYDSINKSVYKQTNVRTDSLSKMSNGVIKPHKVDVTLTKPGKH